jgi:hypothetical protein
MNVKEITKIAKSRGIKPGRLNKTLLIRTIQLNEGNFDCYATAYNEECDQHQCSWRKDCLGQTKQVKH